MSMKNHPLEMYVAKRLSKILQEDCRPTRASGASTEILDIYNSMFFIECKMTKKTENFVLNFNDINKAYRQVRKIGWTSKKVLFVMENKLGDRILLIHFIDLQELVGENYIDDIFAYVYLHLNIGKTQKTFYKEDWDYFYNEAILNSKDKIPLIVFHNRVMNLFCIMDLEDFFYVLEKKILPKLQK